MSFFIKKCDIYHKTFLQYIVQNHLKTTKSSVFSSKLSHIILLDEKTGLCYNRNISEIRA